MLDSVSYPSAKCLDGTQAGYYYQQTNNKENQFKWVLSSHLYPLLLTALTFFLYFPSPRLFRLFLTDFQGDLFEWWW